MKMVIFQPTLNKMEEIDNPKFVPRVGERVVIWYSPTPTVQAVVYDYSENKVIIVVE